MFAQWKLDDGGLLWVMNPEHPLDPSLGVADRARYHVFSFLREKGEATEGEVSKHLFMRLAQERDGETLRSSVLRLLATVGHEVAPHRWRFDLSKVVDYKQLRLLFRPSRADEIRERIERHVAQVEEPALRLDLDGIAALRDRLREANTANRQFASHCARLMEVLQTVLWRLESGFGDQVELALAAGDWATEGVDLRNLPFEDIVIDVVVRTNDRSFELYWRLAEEVFTNLRDEDILVQFRLRTYGEWTRAVTQAEATGRRAALGLPLLTRT